VERTTEEVDDQKDQRLERRLRVPADRLWWRRRPEGHRGRELAMLLDRRGRDRQELGRDALTSRRQNGYY